MSDEVAAQDLPLVHPVYLRLLVAGARAEGIGLAAWLAPLGLEAGVLARRKEAVPLALWRRLMLGLQRLEPRPCLALRLGRGVPLLAHGPLAYLMASSRDLRQALESLVRFAPLRLAVLNLQLRERGQCLELHVRPRVALGDVEGFTLDFLLAMLCTMLEQLYAGACQPATLRLPAADSDTVGRWAEQGVAVERGSGRPLLVLPMALADGVLPLASPPEQQRAWRACEDAERELGWAASLAARIEQFFRTGAAARYQLAQVAQELGVSRRTLMRRLEQEGTSFSALVDASRRERLLRRLGERQLTLSMIADDLGYADAAVLSRAVRRWFGISPRSVQARLDAGLPTVLAQKANSLAPDVMPA